MTHNTDGKDIKEEDKNKVRQIEGIIQRRLL